MVKISLAELEAALELIKKQSNDLSISISYDKIKQLDLIIADRSGNIIKIELFDEDTKALPKVHNVQTLSIRRS